MTGRGGGGLILKRCREVLARWILIAERGGWGGDWKMIEGCEMPCCTMLYSVQVVLLYWNRLRDWNMLCLTNELPLSRSVVSEIRISSSGYEW